MDLTDNSKVKILVADDEEDILEILKFNLLKEKFEVFTARDGDEAIIKAKESNPDLIVLDMMMPVKNGLEVCEILRSQKQFNDTVIVFLTAVSDENTHVKGLTRGADDYIHKPISPAVFITKVKSLLRRVRKPGSKAISINGMTIDPEKFIVFYNQDEFTLAKKEFELLYLLGSSPGKVFLRNEILSQIWGEEVIVGDRTIDVHIRKIRQKLGIECITTVKGVGYKFDLAC